jgi:hypothetical protein
MAAGSGTSGVFFHAGVQTAGCCVGAGAPGIWWLCAWMAMLAVLHDCQCYDLLMDGFMG